MRHLKAIRHLNYFKNFKYSKSCSVSKLIPDGILTVSLCSVLIGGLFLSTPSYGQPGSPQSSPASTASDATKVAIIFVMGGIILVLLIVLGLKYWQDSRSHKQKLASDGSTPSSDATDANSRMESAHSTAYGEVCNQTSPQPASPANNIPLIAPVALTPTSLSNTANSQPTSREEHTPNFSGASAVESGLTTPSASARQRIGELEAELAGRFQEVKDLKAEVMRLTAEMASADDTPTAQQSQELDGLTVRLKQAEANCAIEQAKYSDEFATNRRLSDELEAKRKAMNELTDPAEIRPYLVPRPDLPETIQVFARDLYLLWDRAKTGAADDRTFLVSPDGLRLIDSYVYSAPATYGRLAQEKNGQNLQIEDMLRIATLQKELHGALQKLGITPIIPGQGDPFDPKRHDADEADVVWVQDQSLHNTIVTVKRSGYADGDRVLRRAQVKRRLCGTPDLAGASIPMDYATQTKLQDLEEARRELENHLAQRKAENLNLKDELEKLRDNMSDQHQRAESPTAVRDALQARMAMEAEFSIQIQRLQAENAALLSQIQSAQQNQTTIQELQTEILGLRAQITVQNQTLADARAAIEIEARARERIEHLQIDNDVLRRQLQSAISAQTEIESRAWFESQTRINAQARTESLQKEIDALRDHMVALTSAQSRPAEPIPLYVAAPEPPVLPSDPPPHSILLTAPTDDEDLLGTAG